MKTFIAKYNIAKYNIAKYSVGTIVYGSGITYLYNKNTIYNVDMSKEDKCSLSILYTILYYGFLIH